MSTFLSLSDQSEAELAETMRAVATAVQAALPPKTLFVAIAFDEAPGMGQYVGNCERACVVEVLREVASRLEKGEESPR